MNRGWRQIIIKPTVSLLLLLNFKIYLLLTYFILRCLSKDLVTLATEIPTWLRVPVPDSRLRTLVWLSRKFFPRSPRRYPGSSKLCLSLIGTGTQEQAPDFLSVDVVFNSMTLARQQSRIQYNRFGTSFCRGELTTIITVPAGFLNCRF
jgi:hypothetical protein